MNDTCQRAKELGAPFNCQICGEEERLMYVKDRQELLAHHRLCFSCCFWVERFFRHISDRTSFIVEGEAYIANPASRAPRAHRGHGGRVFRFHTKDGRIVISSDVWHQGTVPDQFRHLLPDNATLGS